MHKELLTAGADVNSRDTNNYTALISAAMRGSIRLVKVLMSAGADVNITDIQGYTALDMAINNRNVDFVRKLIAAGADVKLSLINSVKAGNCECVEEILKTGANCEYHRWRRKDRLDGGC